MLPRTLALVLALAACATTDRHLDTRVAALEHAPPPPSQDEAMARKLDELNARIAELERLETEVHKLEGKLDALAGARTVPVPAPRRPEPRPEVTYSVPIDNDPVLGAADAKVTMVIACDYASPYCEKLRDTLDALHQKYPSDLRFAFKQFVVHPTVATASALAACAAGKRQRFADMDRLLWDKGFKARTFDRDDPNGGKCGDNTDGCPVVAGFAAELKLDPTKFKADMKSCIAVVEKDMHDLQALGVGATPTSFINGRFLSGAQPVESFAALIDEELVKATDQIKAGTPKATYYKKFVVDAGVKTVVP